MPILARPDTIVHYELEGHGAPVLWIQGVGVTGSGWRPQVTELARQYSCLSFDNRGIGKSAFSGTLTIEQMAADAVALMDHVAWQSAHVVGHSMGGIIAQQLALNAPDRVRSLSLLCTFSRGPEAARLTASVLWMGLRTFIGTRPMRRSAFLDLLFSKSYLAGRKRADLAAEVKPIIGRDLADRPPVIMNQLAAMRNHDCSGRLQELAKIRTLVVSAVEDPIALPEYGRRLSSLIPGSRFLELQNAAHAITIQDPPQVNRLLRDHFEGTPPAP